MSLVKDKIQEQKSVLREKLEATNDLALPRIQKVVVSVGTGRNRDKNELVADRLTKITGQKASPRSAKKSIASYKLREGDVIGQSVTLRRGRMYDFLDRLLNAVIPRIRDFRGFDRNSIDEMGNLTVGIKEHIAFPETADEDNRDVFGLSVTITTSARNRKEAEALFDAIGFPFRDQ